MSDPPDLSQKQRSFLRSRGHVLDARVALGKQGASEGFLRQLSAALEADELVKVRLPRRLELDLEQVGASVGAALVSNVGRTAVFYRPASEPTLRLPPG